MLTTTILTGMAHSKALVHRLVHQLVPPTGAAVPNGQLISAEAEQNTSNQKRLVLIHGIGIFPPSTTAFIATGTLQQHVNPSGTRTMVTTHPTRVSVKEREHRKRDADTLTTGIRTCCTAQKPNPVAATGRTPAALNGHGKLKIKIATLKSIHAKVKSAMSKSPSAL